MLSWLVKDMVASSVWEMMGLLVDDLRGELSRCFDDRLKSDQSSGDQAPPATASSLRLTYHCLVRVVSLIRAHSHLATVYTCRFTAHYMA